MRAVLFEGTPEEFARVEGMFWAGAEQGLQTRSIVLPQSRPRAWPELGAEHCYQLAKRVLERAPASLVEALGALAELQNLHGEQTIEDWASYANRLPEELGGTLAELGRGASRAFIELFGCASAPERVRGAAYMLLEKIPSEQGAYFVVRPGLMRALADMDLLDTPSMPNEIEEAPAPAHAPTATASRSSPPAAKAPPVAARPVPVRQPVVAARSDAARLSGSPGGFLGDVARALSPFGGSTRSPAPAPPAGAEEPAPAAKAEHNPFSVLNWADPKT